MDNCRRCGGQTFRVTDSETGERLVLDHMPRYGGEYALDPDDQTKASKIKRPGLNGFTKHADTCGLPG